MRKRKKRNKKTFSLIFIILIILVSFGVGYSILKEQLTISGKVTIKGKPAGPVIPDKKDLEVNFMDNGSSGTTYKYGLSLKNTTTRPSSSWTVYILVPSDTVIVSKYGCNAEIKDGVLIITNTYNGYISPGGSINWEVGITLSTSDSSILPFKYASEIQ